MTNELSSGGGGNTSSFDPEYPGKTIGVFLAHDSVELCRPLAFGCGGKISDGFVNVNISAAFSPQREGDEVKTGSGGVKTNGLGIVFAGKAFERRASGG